MKAKIAIATGDPAGIGPEISLKAALDPAVRAACDPVLVERSGRDRASRESLRHRGGAARHRAPGRRRILHRQAQRARLQAAGGGQLVSASPTPVAGRASIAFVQRGGQGRAGRRGRRRGRRAAERDLDRASRHQVRRPSVVRRARDRHRRERRVHDAVLRRHQDRACHAASERTAGDRRDHAASASRASSTPPSARSSDGRRRAKDRRQRAQSACRRRRAVRLARRSRSSSRRSKRRWPGHGRRQVRSAPTPCFT